MSAVQEVSRGFNNHRQVQTAAVFPEQQLQPWPQQQQQLAAVSFVSPLLPLQERSTVQTPIATIHGAAADAAAPPLTAESALAQQQAREGGVIGPGLSFSVGTAAAAVSAAGQPAQQDTLTGTGALGVHLGLHTSLQPADFILDSPMLLSQANSMQGVVDEDTMNVDPMQTNGMTDAALVTDDYAAALSSVPGAFDHVASAESFWLDP